jgi:FG-GAP repeat protein
MRPVSDLRRRLVSGVCVGALAALLLGPAVFAQQGITVTSAVPNTATQGTVNLNVAINGNGFKKGALAHFFLSGTTDPGGITVNSTTFGGANQVVANIDVSSTADIANFDIVVENTDGREGKGTELFSVFSSANAAAQSCVLAPLPSIFGQIDPATGAFTTASGSAATLVGLNTIQSSGQPAYSGGFGVGLEMKTMTFGTRTVILAAVFAPGGSHIEVFFLDPTTGQVLDGQALDPSNPTVVQPHLTIANPFGSRSTAIGDVNGDGIPDLASGNGATSPGTAGVFLGSMTNGVLGFTPVPLTPTGQTYNALGYAVAFGDLDQDTVQVGDEVVVGAAGGGTGKGVVGKVFVFKFNNSLTSPAFTLVKTLSDPGGQTGDQFGQSVAVGDVAGDTTPDLIVGAQSASVNGVKGTGAAYVYPGTSSGGLLSLAPFVLTAGIAGDGLGHSVASGDVTGDGFRDVIVSTGWANGVNIRAAVFGGLITSNRSAADFSVTPNSFNMGQGWTTTAIKTVDLNGDGRADLLIGAPNASPGSGSGCNSPGAAYVFLSDPANPTAPPTSYMLQAPAPDADFAAYGWSIAAVPGSRLVLVGEQGRNLGGVTGAGQVYVYRLR